MSNELNLNCTTEAKSTCSYEYKPTPEEEISNLKRELRFERDSRTHACDKVEEAGIEIKALTKVIGMLSSELSDMHERRRYILSENHNQHDVLDKIWAACNKVVNDTDKSKNKTLKEFAKKIIGYVREA